MSQLKVCIVGPGVVGQATGKALVAHGIDVSFLGGNISKTEKLRNEGFKAYQRDELVNGQYGFDITMFTVPTPTQNGKIDLSAMDSASVDLGKRMKNMKKYHLVVVKSTVLPGTTENLVLKNIEKYSGKIAGRDFGVCMNPEYLREETALSDSIVPWLIVIGQYDKKSGDVLREIYKKFDCPIMRCSIKEAEMQKYVHNLYNAVKITFFNEMRHIAKQIGVDTQKIFKMTAASAEGMWNPEYGTRERGPFKGSCLPKDTQAFWHWAHSLGFDAELLKRTIEVNNEYIKKLGIDTSNIEYTL